MDIQWERIKELDDRIGVLSAQIHAASAELVGHLAELDQLNGWHGDGYRSITQWLGVRSKFTPSEARRYATAASHLDAVSLLHADALAGKVSVALLAEAARLSTPENERVIAEIVRQCTPTQALRVLAKYRELNPGREGEPDPDIDYWMRRWVDDLGRERFDLALDKTTGALFRQAWDAARASGEKVIDTLDLEQRRRLNANEVADRLATMVLEAANKDGLTSRGGEKYHVQIVAVSRHSPRRWASSSTSPAQQSSARSASSRQRASGSHRASSLGSCATRACSCSSSTRVCRCGWAEKCAPRPATNDARCGSAAEVPAAASSRAAPNHASSTPITCSGPRSSAPPTRQPGLALLVPPHADPRQRLDDHHRRRPVLHVLGRLAVSRLNVPRRLATDGPPDLTRLPGIEQPVEPPDWITSDTPRSGGGGERLSRWALGVYLDHLLAA